MKRGAGFLAMVAFLLTGIRFASGPATIRETSEVKAAETARPESKMPAHIATTCPAFELPSANTGNPENARQRQDGDGQIADLVDRFVYGTDDSAHLQAGGLPEGVRLMIVTIPDPRHTHLSLQFDRTLEAIQQAAQDEKYTYDSSWLPWKNTSTESGNLAESKAESQESARLEACPGLLLFRKAMSGVGDRTCKEVAPGAPLSGNALFHCGMLIFVVAEKPTEGLNRTQWDNALHWIDTYASKTRPDKVLRVLGPNFSGSMPSFVRAVEDTGVYAGTFTSTLLYTGRIRGCASWRWLKRELNPFLAAGMPPPTTVKLPVRVADFEENDALQAERLYRYLKDRGHRLSEIAVLSEDETAYGGLPDAAARLRDPASRSGADTAARSAERQLTDQEGSCSPEYPPSDRPVHLYYPRDISAVRSAYQEQSIFSSGPGSESSGSQPHTVLRPESGAGVHEETDTIAPFSGNNLALTQEAQLYGIVNTLKAHGIRYIVLRSTNSLDYLFLTRFLHRTDPTAYIITMGSDLLFAREVDSTEFRGVMALSTFPLLPRGQDWTTQADYVPQHAHRVFGAYTMEGAYIAARFLLTDPGVNLEEISSGLPFRHPAKPDLPDYALPFWESDETSTVWGTEKKPEDKKSEDLTFEKMPNRPISLPDTWLTVIGREGYWPVATLKETLGASPGFSNLAVVERPRERFFFISWRGRLELPSSWRILCILAMLALAIHAFAGRTGWKRQDLDVFVKFTPIAGERGPVLMSAGWVIISCLLTTLFMVSCRLYVYLSILDKLWVLLMGTCAVVSIVLAGRHRRWWQEPLESPTLDESDPDSGEAKTARRGNPRFSPRWTILTYSVVGLYAFTQFFVLEFDRLRQGGIISAYRSVHLTSGVSPIMSVVVLCAGFYWWFWNSLFRLSLLGNGRSVLPRVGHIHAGLSQISDRIAADIEEMAVPFPRISRSTLLQYSAPGFLLLLIAFAAQGTWMNGFDLVLHSLENSGFDRTLHLFVAVGLFLLVMETSQYYMTWLVFRRLLLALNRLPLRRTFTAIYGLSMRSLWSMSGTSSRPTIKVLTLQLESLLHLGNALDDFESRDCGNTILRQEVRTAWAHGRQFMVELGEGPDFALDNNPAALANRMRLCECAEIVMTHLLVPEWQHENVSLDLRTSATEKDGEDNKALSHKNPVQLGEEFICLIYVGYIQSVLGSMRSMVMSVGGVFASIALALGLYPYTPRPTLTLSLLILLLLIGTIVGLVFAGLDRDSTLSHITKTVPGSLGSQFWVRMLSFIGAPAVGLLVAQFPEIANFVFSWVGPAMGATK